MIDNQNLNLIRKIWPDTDAHDYASTKLCLISEVVRILNLAREEGRAEIRSSRGVVRVQTRKVPAE
jgi:hypothetical protein